MLLPRTLVSAFGLAKLREEYLSSTRRSFWPQPTYFSSGRQPTWGFSGGRSNQQGGSSTPPNPTVNRASATVLPVHKISPTQIRERREKGLYYSCDEKWNSSHCCKSPKLYLIHGHELCADEKLEEVFYDSTDMVEPGSELLLHDHGLDRLCASLR